MKKPVRYCSIRYRIQPRATDFRSSPRGPSRVCIFGAHAIPPYALDGESALVRDRDGQPSWLRKSRSLQRRRRALELNAESWDTAVATAEEHQRHLQAQGRAYGDPLRALETLRKRSEEAKEELRAMEEKRKRFRDLQAEDEVRLSPGGRATQRYKPG